MAWDAGVAEQDLKTAAGRWVLSKNGVELISHRLKHTASLAQGSDFRFEKAATRVPRG